MSGGKRSQRKVGHVRIDPGPPAVGVAHAEPGCSATDSRPDGSADARSSASRRALCDLGPAPSRSCATPPGHQEMVQVPPPPRALRQPDRHHQVPAGQAGEHHRQRAGVSHHDPPGRAGAGMTVGWAKIEVPAGWVAASAAVVTAAGNRACRCASRCPSRVPTRRQVSQAGAAFVWERARPGSW